MALIIVDRVGSADITITGTVVDVCRSRFSLVKLSMIGKNRRTFHLLELGDDSFSLSFSFPMNLVWNKANASFERGMLKVEFPKRDRVKPRRIKVQ